MNVELILILRHDEKWFSLILIETLHTTMSWLVVWTPLKNISQLGWLFQIYGKIKNGNQTTNQMSVPFLQCLRLFSILDTAMHLVRAPSGQIYIDLRSSCGWNVQVSLLRIMVIASQHDVCFPLFVGLLFHVHRVYPMCFSFVQRCWRQTPRSLPK